MIKKRKIKVFEYTTPEYGKGYVSARNEKTALRKLSGTVLHPNPALAITHYDNISKHDWRKKRRYEI